MGGRWVPTGTYLRSVTTHDMQILLVSHLLAIYSVGGKLPIKQEILKKPSRTYPAETIFELDMFKRKLQRLDSAKTSVRFEFC